MKEITDQFLIESIRATFLSLWVTDDILATVSITEQWRTTRHGKKVSRWQARRMIVRTSDRTVLFDNDNYKYDSVPIEGEGRSSLMRTLRDFCNFAQREYGGTT
jgi:hypothetical protein